MKHICFFTGDIGRRGGTERVTCTLANTLVQHGYPVTVLSLYAGQGGFLLDSAVQLAQLFPCPKRLCNPISYGTALYRLRQFIKQAQVDVLIDVESMLALYSVPALWRLKVSHITWEHFHFYADLGRRLRRLARHLAAACSEVVVTLTEKDRSQWLAATRWWRRATVISIPNPLPFEVPVPVDAAGRAPLVLAVGRLTPQKGFDLLLHAWHKVMQQAPQWKLRIIGDGAQRAALENLQTKLGLTDSVALLPATSDIEQHYREASVYVLSSRFEGFGMVLLEAQSYGLPCVSFNCLCGPDEIIKEGITGLLLPPGEVGALAEGLLKLIAHPERCKQMGEAARRCMQEKFTIETILPQWKELFALP